MFQVSAEIIKIKADTLLVAGDFPITSTFSTTILTTITIIILCIWASSFSVLKPSKLQLILESTVSSIITFIDQVSGDRDITKKILPIVLSIIGFLLISNLILTVIPFLGAITIDGKGMFRSSTSDINVSLPLAFSMVVLSQIFLIRRINLIQYIFKFIPVGTVIVKFKKGVFSGLGSIIDIFISLLDIIGEFAKIASLSLRLLGNMFAGELLLRIFMSLFAIILPIPIIMLGSLSGLVQAFVFGALVTSYFSSALKEEN